MRTLPHPKPLTGLVFTLVLAAGCEYPTTQPVRSEPSEAIQADRAPFKSVFALEPLPGTAPPYSAAYWLNDLGQAVGTSSSSGGSYRAVIWDNSTIPQDLGTLPGGVSSAAAAISNDGRVIAGSSSDGLTTYPVRWLNSNGQWLIDQLPGATNCFVNGISPDGTAIIATCGGAAVVWLNGSQITLALGYGFAVNAKGQAVGSNAAADHALLWTFGNGSFATTDLGTLGGTYAVAININDAGEVTGWSENADHVSNAFLWSPKKGAMTDLGPTDHTSGGYGINATGQVVGDVFLNSQHGGFYDRGKFVDLGVLPGYSGGIAHSLNNNGQAVGWSYSVSFQTRATEWVLK